MDGTENLSIKHLVRTVTTELLSSRDERLAAGEAAVFEVSDLTLEISFVATQSRNAGGGFDIKVVKADAGVKYDDQSVHKIVLKLTAAKAAERTVDEPFGIAEPLRPRRTVPKSSSKL
jgi:hypothetical protein